MKKTMKVILTSFLLTSMVVPMVAGVASSVAQASDPAPGFRIPVGAYRGLYRVNAGDRRSTVHMMIHPIAGRSASFLVVLMRLPGSDSGAWAEIFVADPKEAGKDGMYVLTPFRLKPSTLPADLSDAGKPGYKSIKDGSGRVVKVEKETDFSEIEVTNAAPAYFMSVNFQNNDVTDPHFQILDAGNGVHKITSQLGTAEFRGRNSAITWSDQVFAGQFKATGVRGRAATIADWSIGKTDRTQQAFLNNSTNSQTLENGGFEIREKIPGIFSVKRVVAREDAIAAKDDSSAIAFFYHDANMFRRGAHNLVVMGNSASNAVQSQLLRFYVSRGYDSDARPTEVAENLSARNTGSVQQWFGVKRSYAPGSASPVELSYQSFSNTYAPGGNGSQIRVGTDLRMSQPTMDIVRQYANESSLALRRLLEDIELKPSAIEKRERLLSGLAAISARGASSNVKLLMNTYLNETLKLVSIIDFESRLNEGRDTHPAGLIDLEVRLLMRAGRRALQYFDSDLAYVNGTAQRKTGDSPKPDYFRFLKFTAEFTDETLDTLNSVLDATAQYHVMYELARFQRFYMSDSETRQFTAGVADAISAIDDSLKEMPDPTLHEVYDDFAVEKVRTLRGIVKRSRTYVAQSLKDIVGITIDEQTLDRR